MHDAVDLTAIDQALAAAAPTIDRTGRCVAEATYRTLARASPARPGDIATAAGVDVSTVEDLLDGWGAVFRNDAGQVIGFWGLAITETSHHIRVGDEDLYTWCAWDPLFLARLIGPLSVVTVDPETGAEITYGLDSRGDVQDLSHADSVLSFLRPDRAWDDQIVTTFCHYVHHFTSRATAEQWTARHDGTFCLGLGEAVELARRHVARSFGHAR